MGNELDTKDTKDKKAEPVVPPAPTDDEFKKEIGNLVEKSQADDKNAKADDKPKGDDDKPKGDDDKPKDDDKPVKSAFDSVKKPDDVVDETPKPDGLDDIKLPEDAPKKAQESFAEMRVKSREVIKSKDTEIIALKKQLAEGGGEAADAKLKEEYDKVVKRLAQIDVASSPEYKEKITDPRAQLLEQLNALWKENKIEGSVQGLLGKEGMELSQAVDEIAEKIPGMEGKKLVRYVESLEALNDIESKIVDNADTASVALHQNNQKRMEEVFETSFKEVLNKDGVLLDKMTVPEKEDDPMRKGIEFYNESIDRLQKRAHTIATGDLNEKDIANVATMAALGEHLIYAGIPQLNAEYMKMKGLLAEAARRLQSLQGGTPQPSSGDITDPPEKGHDYSAPYSEDAFQKALKNVSDDLKRSRQ